MAVPRNRLSNARKNSRRSHLAKKPQNTTSCPNCAKPKLSHRICTYCGHYGGRCVVGEKAES